jgi:hypothetical protein
MIINRNGEQTNCLLVFLAMPVVFKIAEAAEILELRTFQLPTVKRCKRAIPIDLMVEVVHA